MEKETSKRTENSPSPPQVIEGTVEAKTAVWKSGTGRCHGSQHRKKEEVVQMSDATEVQRCV